MQTISGIPEEEKWLKLQALKLSFIFDFRKSVAFFKAFWAVGNFTTWKSFNFQPWWYLGLDGLNDFFPDVLDLFGQNSERE